MYLCKKISYYIKLRLNLALNIKIRRVNPCVVFIFLLLSQCSWVWVTRCSFGFFIQHNQKLYVKILDRCLLHPNYRQYKQHIWSKCALLALLDHIYESKCYDLVQERQGQKHKTHTYAHTLRDSHTCTYMHTNTHIHTNSSPRQ